MDFEFDEIPLSTRSPGNYFELNTKDANSALPSGLNKILIIAQYDTSGTAVKNVPIPIFSTEEAKSAFVRGSIAHVASRDAIIANPNAQLYVCPIEDLGAAVKAARTLTVTASTVVGGKIIVKINNKRFEVPFSEGQTASQIATTLSTALSTDEFLPYTVTVSSGVVTLTAVSAGELASLVPIEIDNTLANGASLALAESVAGSGIPDITDALAGIAPKRFQVISSTLNDPTNLGLLRIFIDSQSGAIEKKAGRVHYSSDPSDTISEAIALASPLNNGRCTNWYCRKSTSASFSIVSAAAAVEAGEEKASRPLNGLELVGIGVPTSSSDYFTNTENEALLYGGVAPLVQDSSESRVVVKRWITTYTNKGGTPGSTLLDGMTMKSLDFVRDAVVQAVDLAFDRTNVEEDTPNQVRSIILATLYDLQPSIIRNVDDHKDRLIVVEGDAPGTLLASIPSQIVPGLHNIFGIINLIL